MAKCFIYFCFILSYTTRKRWHSMHIVTGSSLVLTATKKLRPWKRLISFMGTWWNSSLYSVSTSSMSIGRQFSHCTQTKSNNFEKVVRIAWLIICKHNQEYKWTYFSFHNWHLLILPKSDLTYLSLQDYSLY